jgi:hypothetical protein
LTNVLKFYNEIAGFFLEKVPALLVQTCAACRITLEELSKPNNVSELRLKAWWYSAALVNIPN